jgi:molecular chaperone GrpE
MDHIELALKHFDSTDQDNAILDGFMTGIRELRVGFSKAGLSIIDASPGSEFNPELHEAIARVYSVDIPRTHIVEEHRRGFLLDGKLYRPSQVSVSGGDDPDLVDQD